MDIYLGLNGRSWQLPLKLMNWSDAIEQVIVVKRCTVLWRAADVTVTSARSLLETKQRTNNPTRLDENQIYNKKMC